MAERNQQVMDMVAGELEKDPDASLDALYSRAVELDPTIEQLSKRQFHARYPLQIKRQRAPGTPRKRPGARKRRGAAARRPEPGAAEGRTRRSAGGPDREKLRALFLEFATDFAAAESRSDIVRVISSVDTYVDRAGKLMGR